MDPGISGTRLGNTVDTIIPMQKNSQETEKSLHKFLEPTRKPCEELSWKHCTSTLHRSETKEATSAVLFESGLNEKCSADSMDCCWVCETYKISCLMERHLVRGGSEYHLKAGICICTCICVSMFV